MSKNNILLTPGSISIIHTNSCEDQVFTASNLLKSFFNKTDFCNYLLPNTEVTLSVATNEEFERIFWQKTSSDDAGTPDEHTAEEVDGKPEYLQLAYCDIYARHREDEGTTTGDVLQAIDHAHASFSGVLIMPVKNFISAMDEEELSTMYSVMKNFIAESGLSIVFIESSVNVPGIEHHTIKLDGTPITRFDNLMYVHPHPEDPTRRAVKLYRLAQ